MAEPVVISTGKSDWPHEVTEVSNSLAEHLSNTHNKLVSSSSAPRPSKSENVPPGVFTSVESNRLSVLNGSHHETGTAHTVLVFPDYKLVKEVPATAEGATSFWKAAIDPAVGVEGKRGEGWDVHTQVDDPAEYGHPALEDLPEPRADAVLEQLREIRKPDGEYSQRVLILRNSHVGGHKFAGNVIIYFPTGNGVWYGRVSPHEVQTVVGSTIIGGKVLPALLRGGTFKRDGHPLMDW
ncbi:hypothetical protein FRC10_012166 [Ceratobasidium sp. 414]|nr:hypothetical protein FRC10_012166 [Ceratobasidium sp. 414]